MKNVLTVIAALALATATATADESSTPPNQLTFHVASSAPDTGFQEMVIEGSDKQIFVDNTPALSRKDYASVCFETDDKGVIMAPQIRDAMTKSARIDGRFSNKDLRQLFDALVLLNDREVAAK